MKRHINIIIILLGLLSASGCDLRETIYGTISDNSFWQTEKDIREGLNGAYGNLLESYHGFSIWQYIIEDAGTDYSAATSGYPEFYSYSGWSGTYPAAVDWGIYKYFWNQISYINKTLDRIPDADMSDELKARYTGEGRTLRAFVYFTLVQWFKDIPLITSSTDDRYEIKQETPETIYAFLEKELIECQEGMLTKEELQAAGEQAYVHFTKAAAQALLARVYLVQKKYDECKAACEKLIQETDVYGTYELMSDYQSVFRTKGYNNKENLWVLPADGIYNICLFQTYIWKLWDVEGSDFVRDMSYDVYVGWGELSVTADFYNTFDDSDSRKKTLGYNPACDPNKVMIMKYPAESTNGKESSTDYPVIRWADVLLMYSESLLLGSTPDLMGAVNAANQVRIRANAPAYEAGNFTEETFRMELYHERRRELFFEGCGKRDMIRFGTLTDYIMSVSSDAGSNPERYFYLPIPSSALAANPGLKQNSPDYK